MAQATVKTQAGYAEVEVLDSNSQQDRFAKFMGIREIDPQLYPLPHCEPVSETDRALSILEHDGFNAKEFCEAHMEDLYSGFFVESDTCNWHVIPMSCEHVSQIPPYLIREIGVLIHKGINIRGIAIAYPEPREIRSEVIKQEFIHEVKVVQKVAGISFLFMSAVMKKTIKSVSTMAHSIQAVNLELIPDPVLLVMVEDNWIEIGRWE